VKAILIAVGKGIIWTGTVVLTTIVLKCSVHLGRMIFNGVDIPPLNFEADDFITISFALVTSVIIDYLFSECKTNKPMQFVIWTIPFGIIFLAIVSESIKENPPLAANSFFSWLSTVTVWTAIAYSVIFRSLIFHSGH
jgi:hypothetical protein